jgi:DNA-binding transcriptional LysR family regulator
LSRNRGASEGLLRVSAPRALGGAQVSPVRRDLIRAYPKILAELAPAHRSRRLIDERIDVVVRGALRDSDLVVRKLAANYRIIVAAPDYLESRGTPSVREDLLSCECLLYRSSGGCHGGGGRQRAPSAQPSSTMRIFSSAYVSSSRRPSS